MESQPQNPAFSCNPENFHPCAIEKNHDKNIGKKQTSIYRVHTGKFEQNSRTFQGLLKDTPTVFKDYKFMINADLSV